MIDHDTYRRTRDWVNTRRAMAGEPPLVLLPTELSRSPVVQMRSRTCPLARALPQPASVGDETFSDASGSGALPLEVARFVRMTDLERYPEGLP